MISRYKTFCSFILSITMIHPAYCWNALGHRLIAQIAYHHLTRLTKQRCNYYNHAMNKTFKPQTLVNSSVWLDFQRSQKQKWLQEKHYIAIPFTPDGTKVSKLPNKEDAVLAIEKASTILKKSSASNINKGFNLRILLHVVGDLHQPLHAAEQYSARYPQGDKGGNLILLRQNPVASNLHAYWDRGGGFLIRSHHFSQAQLNRKAYLIEKHWPCHFGEANLNPHVWAQESHRLARYKAYTLKERHKPGQKYQRMVKRITEQRIAIAGCRLAALLNSIIN